MTISSAGAAPELSAAAEAAAAPKYATRTGAHLPLGAHPTPDGVNFCLFARDADFLELCLYQQADSKHPFQVIRLLPEVHRIFHLWHVFVVNLPVGTHYTWRVLRGGQESEACPELVDPWARAVSAARWDRRSALDRVRLGNSLRGIVSAPLTDELARPESERELGDVVIYELHVGGFTRHPSAYVQSPGTFAGLVEKIPYLKELGITHVELMPIMAFDDQDVPEGAAARGLRNYWGYSTYGFYAPHPSYCVDPSAGPAELRACVSALHRAGIGVLMDVVFNHTAEGGAEGPTLHFKALANDIFYHQDRTKPGSYRDYTGCGNTVNCNHPLVTAFVVHCLEYWADILGIDGFRFDLASVLARGEDGSVLANPSLPWSIELSRSLIARPVIAEAWDAAGLYHVGSFPGMRWSEWNGRYRDVVRRFVRGEAGTIGELATRMAGSEDMYRPRTPLHSVNFVTCHDGFTLVDLVSHNEKHNLDNGEEGRDGTSDNLSFNCGEEGESADPAVLALRRRQAKNFMAILLLSQGAPMLLAGDEVLRSQRGNNNAYCQDNELSWFDWRLVDRNVDMLRFTRGMIALRKRHPSLRRRRFLRGAAEPERADVAWHGERLYQPAWDDPTARLLAFTLAGVREDEPALHVVLNMAEVACDVELPRGQWRRLVDTAQLSPDDVVEPDRALGSTEAQLRVAGRSVVVLERA